MDEIGSSAEGQYLGYSFQLNRLVSLLILGRDGDAVVLERFGDVAVESEDSVLSLVEEVKSRTTSDNPVSDRAPDLWKTLANWLDIIDRGVDPRATEFHLHTSRKFDAPLATRLHSAKSLSQAEEILDDVIATFKDDPPGAVLSRFVEQVLTVDRRAQVCSLIVAVHLSHGSGDVAGDLRAKLRRTAVPEEHIDDVLTYLVGWAKLTTDGLLERREPPVLTVQSMREELRAITRKLDRDTVLRSYSLPPTEDAVQAEVQTRVFVRQLTIIDEPDVAQLAAVRDFLRASVDRIKWAEKGRVHRSDLDELEEDLARVWDNKKVKVELRDGGLGETDRGRLLLRECLEHRCRIQGMETPTHFTAGSFHALADSRALGWHPRYHELLADPKGEED